MGHRYFDTYFQACCNLLKPDGMMLLQAITIADQSYEAYRRSIDSLSGVQLKKAEKRIEVLRYVAWLKRDMLRKETPERMIELA